MEDMGRYILSVTSAAVITGILYSMTDKKSAQMPLIRLVGGLFLAFTMIQPLTKYDFSVFFDGSQTFLEDAEAVAASGEILSREALEERIIQDTEAYILDKAGLYRAALSVEVKVSGGDIPLPESVIIRGHISPIAKQQMQDQIEKDLDISKENQIWIGDP